MITGAIGYSTPKMPQMIKSTYGPAFLGTKVFLKQGKNTTQEELDYEAAQAQKAEKGEVSIPKYKTKGDALHTEQIRYETKGDAANFDTNPLRYRHFRNLFKNFYFLDRAGIFYKNIDGKHLFLQDDGQVEFDCFRNSVNFYQQRNGVVSKTGETDTPTPDFIMPSNEEVFKEGYLSKRITTIEDEDDKFYFLKSYLSYSSEYHQKRAELMAKRGIYRGIEYETTLSEVYRSPSKKVLSFEIDKLNAARKKTEAFSKWKQEEKTDTAGIANKKPVLAGKSADTSAKADPTERFDSVLLELDYIETMFNIKEVAKYFSEISPTKAERKYFAFEEQNAQKKLEAAFSDMKEKGALTFFDPDNKIYLGDESEKEFFLELCAEADFSDGSAKTLSAINDIREYYTELKSRWGEGLNKRLLEEYSAS